MNRKSRQILAVLYILSLFSWTLSSDERWKGPQLLEQFQFDRMSLYGIGWSKAGALAYGVVTPGENESLFWQWFILDLIEDRILYESPRWMLLKDQTPAELWSLHPEWYPQLVRFSIDTSHDVRRSGQIFKFGSDSFRMSSTLDRSESAEYPEGWTKSIRIELYRNHNTAKTVFSYDAAQAEGMIDDLILKGALFSPFEKRSALVCLEKSGPGKDSLNWKYRIIGAHLSLGFSPVTLSSSVLCEAVLNGQFYVTRMLLAEGSDPDSQDARGFAALLLASRLGHWQILELLLEKGAVDKGSDLEGRTALHHAVIQGDAKSIALLMDHGFNPDQKDLDGNSPRILAALDGRASIMKLFR